MATSNSSNPTADASRNGQHQPSEFELRRAAFVGEIGESLEQVLTQINTLNRSLEGIIEIGNEFSSVEALWSQFETVMGRPEDDSNGTGNEGVDGADASEDANTNSGHEVDNQPAEPAR